MKKLIVMMLVMLAAVSVCTAAEKKLNVAVSFNAMNEMVQAVGGNRVNTTIIIPEGTEPHEFSPKPSNLKMIKKADMLVFNGLDMESGWLPKSVKAAGNKRLVLVDASKGATAIKNTDPDTIKEEGQYDPHLWLSIKGAELQTENIKNALIKADPSDKAYYEKNCAVLHAKLNKLFSEYKTKFASVKNQSFVTGHAAFAYFSRDFGLTQNSVEDVFASGEPTAKKLKELTDYCKKHNIKTIFVEDMVSPKVSETLAHEVGARAMKIYTVESKEDGKDYLASIEANLKMIYESMK